MKTLQRAALALLGWGMVTLGSAAQAEPPGVFYSWAELGGTTDQCLGRAQQVLEGRNMTVVRQDNSSVAGGTSDTTAVFVCLNANATTTVMVIVSSTNETTAMNVRDALIADF